MKQNTSNDMIHLHQLFARTAANVRMSMLLQQFCLGHPAKHKVTR